jgi:hypothetical protein
MGDHRAEESGTKAGDLDVKDTIPYPVVSYVAVLEDL